MKRFLFFLLFVSAMLSLPAFAKRYTYGFRLAKLRIHLAYHPEWDVPPNPELHAILQQPFHFIGKGSQCYVFESQDGDYVVKMFRYDQPSSETKAIHLFNACKLAYDFLREETGLVYIHLNTTQMNLPTLYCNDPIGRRVHFALDKTRFAVQKKAKAFRIALQEAKDNPKEMQMRIDQFIDLLQARTAKGIRNSDPNLSRNFGFLENRAVEFDFGNYYQAPDLNRVAEMKRYTSKLRRWLSLNAPEWVDYLDQRVETIQ